MNKSTLATVLGLLVFALLASSVYIIDEREKGIVLQFGDPVKVDVPVGIHFKVPFIQSVNKYDARLQTLDERPDRVITVNGKYLLVDSFVKYKISDVLTFYKATAGSFNQLNSVLSQRVESVLKNQFSSRTIVEVVAGERDLLMSILLSNLNNSVNDLGVEIIDFRVKRIDLPPEVSSSVYQRMRTERNRLAEQLRSEGKEIAREIRAVADKDRVVILAEAYKKAEQLRGEGDAESTRIYAEAFGQDPEFYEFTRSLKAYVETFENKSDVLLIDSNSEFFKYLNSKIAE
ncbi:MAG: HflC protein [SAR86 cluster bacterium SAR86B]|uniref:Protein HflC n=1 Tax=SAR86 cluster bacterium SAR86B TaxID=1123867 RepID=J4V614_9GAMM|nr:MAG: HflC protein [SAR86 cluster bacterium SAR86B]